MREGQSVERLKSCIADLKKLATNKGKRGSSQAPSMTGGMSKKDRAQHEEALNYTYGSSHAPVSSSHRDAREAGYGGYAGGAAYAGKHKSSNSHAAADYHHGGSSGAHGGQSSKRPSKQSITNQGSSSTNGGPTGERKQHSTKIANALKKYIHEIEQTTTQIS